MNIIRTIYLGENKYRQWYIGEIHILAPSTSWKIVKIYLEEGLKQINKKLICLLDYQIELKDIFDDFI